MSQTRETSVEQTQKPNEVEYINFGFDSEDTSYPLSRQANASSLIGAFQTVFDHSVYGENWDYETTSNFLESTQQKDYEGRVAVDDGRVVGFVWGHRIEPEMTEKLPDELQNVDLDIFDGESYILDELGVLPEYRGQGIGSDLEELYIEDVAQKEDSSRIIQRTQLTPENGAKLHLDGANDFTAILDDEYDPVVEDVDLVGVEGRDERIYLWREI